MLKAWLRAPVEEVRDHEKVFGLPGRAFTPVALGLLVGLFACFLCAKPAAALPNGFEDRSVASVEGPTALAFTPDGRLLITTKPGQLRVHEDGAPGTIQALDISGKVCANSERGLLGLAVDPRFGTTGNNYVYLYYTYNKFNVCPTGQPSRDDNPVNRVSRFAMSGDTVDRSSEKVLIDNIPSPNGNHNAGDLHFGEEGYLYVSVGDGACDYAEPTRCQSNNDASRDRNILLGKVLRITRDGGIPASNPYTGPNSARCGVPSANARTEPGNDCQETFARGLRNPFRMAFDPDAAGTSFRINDVGGSGWEEIDRGKAGADYAWNVCEGKHDNPFRRGSEDCAASPYTPPIHDYSHNTGCSSITGGAFVPNGAWPAAYDDAYLFGDYVCGKIFKLSPKDGGGFAKTEFATGLGRGGPVAMTFGPAGSGRALYYTTFVNGGEVRRILSTVGNRAPTAALKTTSQNYGPAPLEVAFSGSGSSDPDGDTPLAYLWDFGDGTTRETADATTTHTYGTEGTYTATLRVRDARGAVSDPDTLKVFPGNTPPDPAIDSPSADTLFKVGQKIRLRGSATDAEDSAAPTLSWKVLQHHNGDHTHPWFSGRGNDLAFTAPAPEDLLSTDPRGNYLEIRLTATDSRGLSRTEVLKLRPRTVGVRFESRPTGFRLEVNGETFRAPKRFVSWEGYKLNVRAPAQRHNRRDWAFDSWSDGGTAAHVILTPATSSTYTATFERR